MKYRTVLLLTSLLAPLMPAWGMDNPKEKQDGNAPLQQASPDAPLSPDRSVLPHEPGYLNAGADQVCSPIDPRCGRREDPFAMGFSSSIQVHIQAGNPPHVQVDIQPARKTALSGIDERQVFTHLQGFGFSCQQTVALWEEFSQLMLPRGKLPPFKLASHNPHFVAAGLWRANQECSLQDESGKQALSYPSLLSSLLSHKLYIKERSLRRQDLATLKSLVQSNPYFTTLDLFMCEVGDSHLAFLMTIPHLKELKLEENKITDHVLSLVIAHPGLENLNLSKNQITSKGAGILAQSQRIKKLYLHKNPIGDKGAEYLAQNPVLTYLDLGSTGIGDAGAQALAKNTALFTLILSSNMIGDAGALSFLVNEHLTGLDIKCNHISKDLRFHVEHLIRDRNTYLGQLASPSLALPANLLPAQKPCVRILSVDGGGIRGLLPAYILNHIADELAQRTGAPFHFAKHVDLMAGTSTGGLISLGLSLPGEKGLPKYAPQTLVDLYTEKGKDIFPAPWSLLKGIYESKYSAEGLEAILAEYFGDFCLSSCVANTLIASFDLRKNEPHIFDSFQAKLDESRNFTLAGASRATSAAPTYFPAARVKNRLGEAFDLIDGGIYANNPTLLALKRAQQLYPDAKEYVVLSFGTGQTGNKDLFALRDGGLIRWGLNITDVLMDNAGTYTENLLEIHCQQDPRIKYVRIQPRIENSSKEMDNTAQENIQDLLQAAERTIVQEKEKIDFIIKEFYKVYEKNHGR